jgi:TolA-binding protein
LCVIAQEKKLVLETLRVHKDSSHKLQTEHTEAQRLHAETIDRMNELEHEIRERNTRVEELGGSIGQIAGIASTLRVLEAKRDALVAENTRRVSALSAEIDAPLPQLLEAQVRDARAPMQRPQRRGGLVHKRIAAPLMHAR